MTHEHNKMDPNTDPIFHDTANQPYARRTSSFIFFIGISAIAIVFFQVGFHLATTKKRQYHNRNLPRPQTKNQA